MISDAAVGFAGGELADAKLRQVIFITLIYLRHWQVRGLHHVLTRFHSLRGIRIVRCHGTAFLHADTELLRRGFIILKAETSSDARPIYHVVDAWQSRVRRRPHPGR